MAGIYRGADPRHLPAYAVPEAAHYLSIPMSTLRSWVFGRPYMTSTGRQQFAPVIERPDPDQRLLSFTNLVEAHVLASIRQKHGVTLGNVRAAIDHLQQRYGIRHPLADVRFKTDGVDLFIDFLGSLVNVTRQGQMAMREVLEGHLERVEHGEDGLAVRLFPFTRTGAEVEQPRTVMIDPRVAFGRPVLTGTGIPTAVLADRYKAGDSMSELADDYACGRDLIEEAIRCELAAA